MDNSIQIRMAKESEADVVGNLAYKLVVELFPEHSSSFSHEKMIAAARHLISEDSNVWAFLASTANDEFIGILTLNECAAIYAGGIFGEISELYILPEYRSSNIGTKLIDKAIEFGRNKGWNCLEVGAPDLPRWKKTVDFYKNNGFNTVGPRLELSL